MKTLTLSASIVFALLLTGISFAADDKPVGPDKAEEKPQPAKEVAGESITVNGLTIRLVAKKTEQEFYGRKMKLDTVVVELTNKSDKPILLSAPINIKIKALGEDGQEIQAGFRRNGRNPEPKEEKPAPEKEPIDKTKAVTVTIIKPGQKFEFTSRDIMMLGFRASGKVKITAELIVEPSEESILPGLKMWSGKASIKEVEWEAKRPWGNRRPRNRKPKTEKPVEKPAEGQKAEEF
jgi:hypothetical protein